MKIIENGPAAIALSASYSTSGGSSCSLKYRLTAGQMIVEVRPGQGTDRLAVLAETRYVVVPDFFGDDMVFGAKAVSRPRLRLPAENMLLSLLDGGNAEVMCVWSSNRQEAVALRGNSGADRRLRDSSRSRTSRFGSPAWKGPACGTSKRPSAGQRNAAVRLETAFSGQVAR